MNNYKQAINLLSNGRMTLEWLMHELGVNNPATFKLWLDEERVYLKSLLREPAEETLRMEYWQWLVNLAGSRYVSMYQQVIVLTTSKHRKDVETILSSWAIVTAHNATSLGSDSVQPEKWRPCAVMHKRIMKRT